MSCEHEWDYDINNVVCMKGCGRTVWGVLSDMTRDLAAAQERERIRLVTRLRARATAEQVTADRWAHGGDDRMVALHQKAADVLNEEANMLESSPAPAPSAEPKKEEP